MTVAAPDRKYLVDGLHEAFSHLQWALAHAGRGHEFPRLLQQVIIRHADEATLDRILTVIKSEIADCERAGTDHTQDR